MTPINKRVIATPLQEFINISKKLIEDIQTSKVDYISIIDTSLSIDYNFTLMINNYFEYFMNNDNKEYIITSSNIALSHDNVQDSHMTIKIVDVQGVRKIYSIMGQINKHKVLMEIDNL